MPVNDYEVSLLHEDPGELIMLYQEMIEFIVQKRFINPGLLSRQSREDVIQTINEHLLVKMPYITKYYNGFSLLRTYISVIVRNKCLEIFRSQFKQELAFVSNPADYSADGKKSKVFKKKYHLTELQEAHQYTSEQETEKQIVLEYEFKRFDAILKTYPKQKAKIELCIKYIFHIPCLISEIKAYWPGATKKYLKMFCGKENGRMTKTERYKCLTELISKCENKSNTNDAIRKWLADKITELIYLLNGDPQQNYFDQETFQYFIEEYYHKKENKE